MKQEYINRIRTFNRFYTKILGVLNKSYLGSEFGLPEIRVIQDIYLHPDRNSKDISNELNMDKGLLSRILKKIEHKGYVYKKGVVKDNRMEVIKLTKEGCDIYHVLNAAADQSIKDIFVNLEDGELQELVKSMEAILNIMKHD
jgi:putative acetyltransferase